jgi:hypothetical protein
VWQFFCLKHFSDSLKNRSKESFFVVVNIHTLPWLRSGKVVFASASRTGDPGFESRQGVRF